MLDDARRVGERPVAGVAAHFAEPSGHAGFRSAPCSAPSSAAPF
jgi:hypothetical protein